MYRPFSRHSPSFMHSFLAIPNLDLVLTDLPVHQPAIPFLQSKVREMIPTFLTRLPTLFDDPTCISHDDSWSVCSYTTRYQLLIFLGISSKFSNFFGVHFYPKSNLRKLIKLPKSSISITLSGFLSSSVRN